jgi:hypothetical protein
MKKGTYRKGKTGDMTFYQILENKKRKEQKDMPIIKGKYDKELSLIEKLILGDACIKQDVMHSIRQLIQIAFCNGYLEGIESNMENELSIIFAKRHAVTQDKAKQLLRLVLADKMVLKVISTQINCILKDEREDRGIKLGEPEFDTTI